MGKRKELVRKALLEDLEVEHQRSPAALVLLKLMAQGEADIASGRVTSQHRVFADLRAHLNAMS